MDAHEIGIHLEKFNEAFRSLDDDHEDFDDEIADVAVMGATAYHAFLAKRAATPYGRQVSEFHEFLVPGVVDAYVVASDDGRQQILDEFSQRPFARIVVWSLLEQYRWLLRNAAPELRPVMLRTLLVLAVLDEEDLDQPETAMILSSAWRDAEFAEIEPQRYFREAAALAGRRNGRHGRSAAEFLRNFEPYDFGASS